MRDWDRFVRERFSGLGYTDDTNGKPSARVAWRLLSLQIVGFHMDDQSTTDDRMRAMEAQMAVFQVLGRIAVGVGCDIAQVTNMPLRALGPSMGLHCRIEV